MHVAVVIAKRPPTSRLTTSLHAVPHQASAAHAAVAVAAAAAVTAARQALLGVWPDFASASHRSNKQVGAAQGAGQCCASYMASLSNWLHPKVATTGKLPNECYHHCLRVRCARLQSNPRGT